MCPAAEAATAESAVALDATATLNATPALKGGPTLAQAPAVAQQSIAIIGSTGLDSSASSAATLGREHSACGKQKHTDSKIEALQTHVTALDASGRDWTGGPGTARLPSTARGAERSFDGLSLNASIGAHACLVRSSWV